MNPKLFRHLALLSACLTLAACSGDSSSGHASGQSDGHKVSTAIASMQDVRLSDTLPGTLEALRTVRIFNQEEGMLVQLHAREGDRVKQGQLLAQLDDRLIRAELSRAEANLKQAQLDLQRQENLAAQKLTSEDAIARARTAAATAQADAELYRTHLLYTRITAPFAGLISERYMEAGDVTPKLSHLFTLIDTRLLKAKVFVPENLLPYLALHDAVSVEVDAEGNQTFNGKISRIYPALDSSTRQGTIEIEFDPGENSVLSGQMCRVVLQGRASSRLMIAFDALRHDNDGAFVYVIKDQHARHVPVQTGVQQQDLIEIMQGLAAGDVVVTKGFTGLHDGVLVNDNKQ
jgi:membrane fusion protein (multidrug efflux system)